MALGLRSGGWTQPESITGENCRSAQLQGCRQAVRSSMSSSFSPILAKIKLEFAQVWGTTNLSYLNCYFLRRSG